jgi:hypothetical protein
LIQFQQSANNKDPQASQMLAQFMHAMDDGQGTYADTVNLMCSWNFPKGNFDEADTMMKILDKDPSQENRLNNLVLMHQLRVDNGAPQTGAYRGYMNATEINLLIDQQMNQYLNGELPVPSPGISALFAKFPQWGEHEIKHLSGYGQLDAFMNQLSQSGEPIGQILGPMRKDRAADPALSTVFDQLMSKLITDKNPNGDDIVRDIVSNAGSYPQSTLKQLPSNLLLEMKLLLQMGDEQDLNQPALNLVNGAMTNHA